MRLIVSKRNNPSRGAGSIRQTECHDVLYLLVLHLRCVYHFKMFFTGNEVITWKNGYTTRNIGIVVTPKTPGADKPNLSYASKNYLSAKDFWWGKYANPVASHLLALSIL